MQPTVRYIVVMLCLLCRFYAMQASDYVFRNLTSTDGLSGMLVNTIYKDHTAGYVWIGTDNGVDCFDGLRIKNYAFKDIGQTTKKLVRAIVVTHTGQLIVGNGLGLWAGNELDLSLSRRYAESIDCGVNALLSDGNTLYVGTERGLYIVKDGQITAKHIASDIWAASNHITDMQMDSRHRLLWISTQDGLAQYSLRSGSFKLYRQKNNKTDNNFRCLAIASSDLYIGTMTQGLLVFDTATNSFAKAANVGSNVVSDVCFDGKNTVYVGTDGNGVHLVSHRDRRLIASYRHTPSEKNQISSNSVYSLMVDQRGMLWVGTYRTGLDYTLFRKPLFSVYQCPPDFTTAYLSVNSVSQNGNYKLIGTRDGLFLVNEQSHHVRRFTTPELPSSLILSTAYYGGRFYIGTYGGGLVWIDPATWTVHSADSRLQSGHVFSMTRDAKGSLWIGTSHGVFQMNDKGEVTKHFSSTNSPLPSGNVYIITFDSSGKGWIGTETGLGLYDPQKQAIRTDIFPEGFVNKDKIRYIYEDHRHNIYFVREKGNLFVSTLTMDKYGDINLPFIRRSADNFILSMVEDGLHNLWFACSEGLFRMANLKNDDYDMFTFNDGLPSQMFTNNSTSIASDGSLCFGNTKGWVTISPRSIDLSHHHARVVITSILVNGAETNHSNTLTKSENNLTFFFSDMSFSSPGATYYECMLEGHDDDWHIMPATGSASYNNLPPGTYTFRVRTPGLSDTEQSFTFTIHHLMTWWKWAMLILIVGVIAYFVVRRRRKSVQVAAITVSDVPTTESISTKTVRPLLSEEESEAVRRHLVAYIEHERPYTNKNLKSADVAANLGISLNSMSYVLNQYMHVSFNDFINEYRVNEFKRIATDPQYSNLTLSALSEKCGFGSHASFFRIFKNVTGITPNEYLQQIRQ